jgi:activating signal cointegrator complex subunit 3
LNLAKLLPYVDIQCHVQPVTRSILRFQITLTPSFNWNQRWHGSAQGFWIWIEDSDNIRIYHQEYILFSKRTHPDSINLELVIPAFDPLPPQYFIRVVSDSWVGSEFLLPVSFEHLFMPSTDMPYTDLMDLTPLPTSALGNSKYEQLYAKFEVFNPIQTQLFHVLYHQDTPILLGAPTGSGKTIVAEIALLRMKKKFPSGKCVYIAPLKSLARERLKEWKKKLGGDPLKWKVLELSGDTHHDKRTLEKADVLVCTPEKWDLVSRGWRTQSEDSVKSKNFVKDVRLLIIDEIHLLGEERGAVLEAIVSRTRFISRLIQSQASIDENEIPVNQSHETTRIVGLSTAIANPYDLANWMGIDVDNIKVGAKIGMYNFRPSVRPIPMKVHIQGFAGRHYCPRMATMNKPCYAAIREHSPTKPVIIFVASRRQTRLTALDLINYAASDQNPSTFLGCSDEYALSVADTLHDASLRHTISYGIGLHHAGLSSHDREKVENMFLKGDIQVLVATATLAWGVNLPAHLVIVKGTEFFDGKESRYVDYPVTDVLQMMGRAGRPQFDTEGIACIFVEESKKNFYKKFLYDPFPVESCLDSRMADNLNAEIATGTVVTIEDCVGWLDWTFYARRVRMNPSYYGAESGDDDTVNEFLLQKVMTCIEELKESGCIITPVDDNMGEVAPTYLGVTSSKFYLHHKTPHQMRIGVKNSRRTMLSSLEQFDSRTGEHGFAFPVEVEEIAVASIIYHLAHTYEFSELPVRHNEEQLNAQLADELPWGPLIPVINQGALRKNNNIDLETYLDPCTKCYLLIQAFITDAELPISDYVNDTSTALDQLPRLLAAMENVAMHDMSSEGTFDIYCMFPIVRQILNSRMLPSEDPLGQVYSISGDKMRQLRKQGINLRQLCLMEDYSSLRLTKKVQQEIHLLPLFILCNIQITFKTDKASGKSEGVVSFNLELHQKVAQNRKTAVEFSFDAILGTHSRSILLGQKSITLKVLPHSPGERSRSIEIKFDWDIAKSSDQEDGGSVVLRVFSRDVRGLDVQHVLPLNVAPQK